MLEDHRDKMRVFVLAEQPPATAIALAIAVECNLQQPGWNICVEPVHVQLGEGRPSMNAWSVSVASVYGNVLLEERGQYYAVSTFNAPVTLHLTPTAAARRLVELGRERAAVTLATLPALIAKSTKLEGAVQVEGTEVHNGQRD